MDTDIFYMKKAIKLAKKGKYSVAPNPMVGCIIVSNSVIIAQGYHKKYKDKHAEINALEQVNFGARGCDIYITLEPCSIYGNTPPCVDSILKAKPKRVIIASIDPSLPLSSVAIMKNAGIKVVTGVMQYESDRLNRGFLHRVVTNKPFVTAKIAMSIDGKIAMKSGESKWISCEQSRNDVQKLRAENQAIITGSGTVLADNPNFKVNNPKLPSPIKIIATSDKTKFSNSLNIFQGMQTIISDKSPDDILVMLGQMKINNVLLEGGEKITGSFLQLGLIDELIIYQAPIIMGSSAKSMAKLDILTINNAVNFTLSAIKRINNDLKLTYTKS